MPYVYCFFISVLCVVFCGRSPVKTNWIADGFAFGSLSVMAERGFAPNIYNK